MSCYSIAGRERVVARVLGGKSQSAARNHSKVPLKTVKTWVKPFRETGSLQPKPATTATRPTWWEELRREVQEHPDKFQTEHAERFGVVQSTISKALPQMGITRKKPTTTYLEPNEAPKPAFRAACQTLPAAACVYLDESGIPPNLVRDYGWAPAGEIVLGKRTGPREPKLNILAALQEGPIQAPFSYEGTMNTSLFNTYLTEHLLPLLTPGQVLMMDNATFHTLRQAQGQNRRS